MRKYFIALITIAFFSCNQSQKNKIEIPDKVKEVIEIAGDNGSELEKVIVNYQLPEDSLKLKAAFFLIGNLDKKHSFTDFQLQDSILNIIEFDIDDYKNYSQQRNAWDSLKKIYGEIDFKRKLEIIDYDSVTAEFLINTIELAFMVWENNPWSKHLNFEQFCEYILPHRGTNEPLEDWRSYFFEKYSWVKDSVKDKSNPVEAAVLINEDLRSWFRFDERYYDHPSDQGFTEMIKVKLGRCEDMTNLAIFAMRANGIAVMSDYTPYWANTGNNHAWNAILDKNGKVIIFMGCEANPGEYKLHNKFAKVYRKTYARQENALSEKAEEWEELPKYINHPFYTDVTADYTDVANVELKLDREMPDSTSFAYLCVFNSGKWKAIHWSKIKENKSVVFDKMGIDIIYLPAFYIDEKALAASNPFILDDNGDINFIDVSEDEFIKIELYNTTNRTRIKSSDNIAEANLKVGVTYELYFWNDRWELIGEQEFKNKSLNFKQCPANALYWLKEKDGREEERIFTIDENGIQKWW